MVNALNLQEIDQEQSLNLCRFFIKGGQNILLLGRRGVGKTQIAMQSALECGYKINYINLSVVERPDLAGYPNLHAEGDVVTFKSPYFLPKLKPGEKPNNIILFDELDKASPDVTAPLLEILQFKRLNGQPINVAGCILTGNLLSEGSYSKEISSALLDRVSKYVLSFNFDKWLDWAKLNGVHDLIVSFLNSNPELACGDIETTYYASPSPRGWTLASEALIKAKEYNVVDIESITSIVSGFVGYEAGLRFKIWYEYFRKFEPFILSLLEHGACALDYSTLSPTEKLVFCVTLCHLSKQKLVENKGKNKFQSVEILCNFFDKNDVDLEVQILAIRNSFPGEMVTKHKLYSNKTFFDKFKKITENVIIKK